MHEVLVNRLGGLSLPRKTVVRLNDRPDMTLDVYCGRQTTMQQQKSFFFFSRLVLILRKVTNEMTNVAHRIYIDQYESSNIDFTVSLVDWVRFHGR